MPLFRALVFSSVLVGLIVGVVVTLTQLYSTVPLILQAESYEKARRGCSRSCRAAGAGAVPRLMTIRVTSMPQMRGNRPMALSGRSIPPAPTS